MGLSSSSSSSSFLRRRTGSLQPATQAIETLHSNGHCTARAVWVGGWVGG